MTRPVTNHLLQALLEQASFSGAHAAFARQVVRAAADRYGLDLRYDGASVYWWLRGRSPEQPAPELIAEVLAARLHRPVHTTELGFVRLAPDGEAGALLFPPTPAAAIQTATSLWRRIGRVPVPAPGQGHGPAGEGAPFVAAAVAEAGWRYTFDPPDLSVAHHGGRDVDSHDVDIVRACGEEFAAMDRRRGGGHARTFLAAFLTRDVTPLLRGTYTDTIGRELFQVAAELTGMAAFCAFDTDDQGAAQRAWIQALRLAKAAGDRGYGAHVLANLATQAIRLDLPGEAVRLSHAAVQAAGRRPHPAVAARLLATQANAHALAGDHARFHTTIKKAAKALERADTPGRPAWAGYFTPAHLAGTTMRSLLELDRPTQALDFAAQALAAPAGNARTSALHTALLATVYARAGVLDAAAEHGHQALVLARQVRSRRVTARLTVLTHTLDPHRQTPQVASFLDHYRSLLGQRPAPRVA